MFNKKFARSLPYGQYKWWYSWNLFWWKIEGYDLLNGLNVYKPKDPNSAGFVLKIKKFIFKVRYSKRTNEWHIGKS
jgi:hypothetical protein